MTIKTTRKQAHFEQPDRHAAVRKIHAAKKEQSRAADRRRPGRTTGGFTLIEVLFATMLIGLVIAAIAVSSGAATMVNGVSVDMSTAEFLLEELREQTASVSFDDLQAYDGRTYTPPIDIAGAVLTEFGGFSQQVTVKYVQPANLQQLSITPTDFVRVTVTVLKNNRPVSSASWIRANL